MNSDFDPPPKRLSILASVGGVVTAVVAIASLEVLSNHLHKTANSPRARVSTAQTATPAQDTEATIVDKLDAQSVKLPGLAVTPKEITETTTPYVAPGVGELSPQEMAMARQAWQYFQQNWNDETGLVNSADKFASVTKMV